MPPEKAENTTIITSSDGGFGILTLKVCASSIANTVPAASNGPTSSDQTCCHVRDPCAEGGWSLMTGSDNTPPGLRRQMNANTSAGFLRARFKFEARGDAGTGPPGTGRPPPRREPCRRLRVSRGAGPSGSDNAGRCRGRAVPSRSIPGDLARRQVLRWVGVDVDRRARRRDPARAPADWSGRRRARTAWAGSP